MKKIRTTYDIQTAGMSDLIDHEGNSKDGNYGGRGSRFRRQYSGFPFRHVQFQVTVLGGK